jgi:hypothetical protein
MSQAGHQPCPYRIARDDHDDGNRLRRPSQLLDRLIAVGRDDVELETDQFGDHHGQPLEARFRQPRFDDEILALDVAELAEMLPKRLQIPRFGGVRVSEVADAPDLRRRLRLAGERQGEDDSGEGDREHRVLQRPEASKIARGLRTSIWSS